MAAPTDENDCGSSEKKSTLSTWNSRKLPPPPTLTCSYMSEETKRVCASHYQELLSKMVVTSQLIHQHLESEQFTMTRLLFKLHNQQHRWKWYQLIAKIDKILCRIQTVSISEYVEDITECCYKDRSSSGVLTWHMPSRQMVQHLLVKLISISKLCGYSTALCEQTAVFLVQFLSHGHMVNNNLVLCSLISRIWVLLQAFQSNVIKCYDGLYPWCAELKATPTRWLPSDERLPESPSTWLDSESLPVNLQNKQAKKSKTQKLLSKWFSEQEESYTIEEDESPDDSTDINSNVSASLDLGEPIFGGKMLAALGIPQKESNTSKRLGYQSRTVKKTEVEVKSENVHTEHTLSRTEDNGLQTATSEMSEDGNTKKKKKQKKRKNKPKINPTKNSPYESNTFTTAPSNQGVNCNARQHHDIGKMEAKLVGDSSSNISPTKKRKHNTVHKGNQMQVHETVEASAAAQADGQNQKEDTVPRKKRKILLASQKMSPASRKDEVSSFNFKENFLSKTTKKTEFEGIESDTDRRDHVSGDKGSGGNNSLMQKPKVEIDKAGVTKKTKRKKMKRDNLKKPDDDAVRNENCANKTLPPSQETEWDEDVKARHTKHFGNIEAAVKARFQSVQEDNESSRISSPKKKWMHYSDDVDFHVDLQRETQVAEGVAVEHNPVPVITQTTSKKKKKRRIVSPGGENPPASGKEEKTLDSKGKGLSTNAVKKITMEVMKSKETVGMKELMSSKEAEDNSSKKKKRKKKLSKSSNDADDSNSLPALDPDVEHNVVSKDRKHIDTARVEASVTINFESSQEGKDEGRKISPTKKKKQEPVLISKGSISECLKLSDDSTSTRQVNDVIMLPKKKLKKRKRFQESTGLSKESEKELAQNKINVTKHGKSGKQASSLVCELGQIKHHSKKKKVFKTDDTEIDDIFASLE